MSVSWVNPSRLTFDFSGVESNSDSIPAFSLDFLLVLLYITNVSHLENKMNLLLKSMRIDYCKEFKFHLHRGWRIDFAILKSHIAIECEGAVWTGGRHNHPVGFLKDVEKYNQLTLAGWHLLRFTSKDFKNPVLIIDIIKNLMIKVNSDFRSEPALFDELECKKCGQSISA